MQELTTDFLSAEPQDKAARKQHLGNWGTYAAAAGAALAMSTSASAEIMYSGIQDITGIGRCLRRDEPRGVHGRSGSRASACVERDERNR